MKSNTYIAPNLITSAENQRAMIFFFYLKSKYNKSVFYKYTPERLSRLTGLAINTVRKYVGYLVRKGYAKRLNGNLWLKSTRKISDDRLIHIDSKPWTSFYQFIHRAYAAIIKWDNAKQAFHYNMKSLMSGNLRSTKDVRNFRRYEKTYCKDKKESDNCKPINSTRQIARLFKHSQSWAQNTLSRLVKMKYATTKQQIESLNFYVPPENHEFYKTCNSLGIGFFYPNKRRKITCVHHGTIITLNY